MLQTIDKPTQPFAQERRTRRRVKLARTVLIRPCDSHYSEEVQSTANVSNSGLYFVTSAKHYHVGMQVGVIVGYVPGDPCNSTSFGEVARIERRKDGRLGIAVKILLL